MDAVGRRERLISILNDNDCPSFAVRPTPSPIVDRSLSDQDQLPSPPRVGGQSRRAVPVSPTPPISPPLLLSLDSISSKASSSTMDSPSPKTPVYNYDPQLFTQYDSLSRHNAAGGHLQSPASVTPLAESMMMVASPQPQMLPYKGKPTDNGIPSTYAGLPISPHDRPQPASVPTDSPSDHQLHTPTHAPSQPTKKSKYHCPYASSHNCTATFTTSGHAARHGKKHTGEKGVHCPVCNKAFTRKDNMKQHERTHKGSASGSNSDDPNHQRSKAAVTKDTARSKKATSDTNQQPSKASLIHSPLNEVASIDPSVIGTPSLGEDRGRFNETPMMGNVESAQSLSAYPPLAEEPSFGSLAQLDRSAGPNFSSAQPPIQRTFSDLDTLALAAAYDPYSQGTGR